MASTLKRLRTKRQMSPAELTAKAKIGRGISCVWENTWQHPTLGTRGRLVRAPACR